jgi:hypothetical protein
MIKKEPIRSVYKNQPRNGKELELGAAKLSANATVLMTRHSKERGGMRRIRLDRVDRRFLRNLVTDGRPTGVELVRGDRNCALPDCGGCGPLTKPG